MPGTNPLISDRHVDFVLHEVLDVRSLLALPHFADHSAETFALYLASARKLAREVLFQTYKPMDDAPSSRTDGKVVVHPAMKALRGPLVELGVINATRPYDVGGQQLPATIAATANAYLMAANLSAFGYFGLTAGAARLIESFGSADLKARFMTKMYAGEWMGTMALTEPGAGSSLSDVTTKATPRPDGTFGIRGSKVFISGGDHDLVENIVHLALARIDGAPEGIKGVSLFAIPKYRPGADGALVPNDTTTAGVFHKVGWRGLPSIALNFGDDDDCVGWLVGQPNQGIKYMFQMMNEARLMVGVNGVATASVAYHASLEYAKTRPQGRPLGSRDPKSPQVPIIQHADVRRMLIRQKAIVDGGLCLVAATARYADLAEHATTAEERRRAFLLLDLLTPIAKTFPAERGFESNALAVQIHGGYGYTSEYLPEAWLRDQKLNSIHEGTTGIQSMDLLGRKVVAEGGDALRYLVEEIQSAIARAKAAGVDPAYGERLGRTVDDVIELTLTLGAKGASGDLEGMLLHSVDYLEMFSIVVTSWLWLLQAAVAKEALDRGAAGSEDFYRGTLSTAAYWLDTELPKSAHLASLCRIGERSYGAMDPAWF
ncbi:acyl-CoA dehydrogenase [Myxococcota bacterium]|nr:acyl-CoA dehydrogenase [Myxococcota bacterium]